MSSDAALAAVLNQLLTEDAVPVFAERLIFTAALVSPEWATLSASAAMATLRRLEQTKLVDLKRFQGRVYAGRRSVVSAVAAFLVTREYRLLGMTVLPLCSDGDLTKCSSWLPYVPHECEHRFFELRPSPLGGLGLFLRQGRQLNPGTVAAEYSGSLETRPGDAQTRKEINYIAKAACVGSLLRTSYMVNCMDSKVIFGMDHDGVVLSLASMANDNGQDAANAEFVEFPEYPFRVFLVVKRQIDPGEEVLTMYGARYWGYATYEQIRRVMARNGGKLPPKVPHAAMPPSLDVKCRRCGRCFPRRVKKLHERECGDDLLTNARAEVLNTLPYNSLTADDRTYIPGIPKLVNFTAEFFVNYDVPGTLFNTHFYRRDETSEDPPPRKKRMSEREYRANKTSRKFALPAVLRCFSMD
jgi:hypothetical protein